jgi:uncharacterized protein DUF3302
MLGFPLGFWDYVTFAVLFILGGAVLAAVVLLLGLPGRIARARNHPDADAVNVMGWAGALAVVPWIQAFIWAFKPTTVVDIRRSSAEEQAWIREEAAKRDQTGVAAKDTRADATAVDHAKD